MLCVKALDMCGAMDGRIAASDVDAGMARAKSGRESYRSIFEKAVESKLVAGRGAPSVVAVVVPERERALSFEDRYKVLVVEDEEKNGEEKSLHAEAKELGGEVVMLRFSDDADGMSVVGVGGRKEIGGFFSPSKLKSAGVGGNWSGGSEAEKISMCKAVGERLLRPVDSDSLELK